MGYLRRAVSWASSGVASLRRRSESAAAAAIVVAAAGVGPAVGLGPWPRWSDRR